MPIRVLIVDDSKLIQAVLTEIFDDDARFEVVGVAENPHEARQLIKDTEPDVLTLDVEMPKMNGIAFLRNLMRLRPMPVVMISTLTAQGASVTLEAIEIGALDFVEKPSDLAHSMDEYRNEICDKVVAASQVSRLKLLDIQQRLKDGVAEVEGSNYGEKSQREEASHRQIASHRICAIGGSTGGLEALSNLLRGVSFSGKESILVCLHLPSGFTTSYAKRLNGLLPITVKEAEHGEKVLQGVVYIAPGGRHMEVAKKGNGFAIRINDNEPVNRHKPSVDVLFDSVAMNVGASAIGFILTGMGRDGALGLKRMFEIGCKTFAQDESSSVVWGMPGAAVEEEAVMKRNVLPLEHLSARISDYYRAK
ncbi:chemotaxis response regulator protein-glutamate methylesterase [Alteromonas sp. ASW11-36]|uniref:Protein-glutamate methylesterase/protein-glutamine glutaminase n=1 Tax=Alteromonas arenosi TaxID=3055817 RepID=A0ABT7T0I5_9ALTE|nr:chemotaxis response regulator protein-glutamate methylesterase [Alteromonas sp. ASW11-36]MDM7861900.1 chemotaxis response regulator protein-glutamate methylesterase [Alteromonas sp. ASW11-36]